MALDKSLRSALESRLLWCDGDKDLGKIKRMFIAPGEEINVVNRHTNT